MNVSGKSDEEKTNKSCFPLHLHHTRVLAPTHHVCAYVCVSGVFQSPGLYLFNLARLWFAYLLTSRHWQPWPPGSLKACSHARRHINEEHTGSPALLWAIVREPADGLIFPSSPPGFTVISVREEMLRWCLLKPLPSYFLPSYVEVQMLLEAQHQEGVGGKWNNFVHFNFAFSCIQKAVHVLGDLPWELEKQSSGKIVPCCLCVEELVSIKFSVVQESHHDPLLGLAEAGGRGTKPAAGRGLIVAFNNKWVLLRFLWNCLTELAPQFLASINPWAAS